MGISLKQAKRLGIDVAQLPPAPRPVVQVPGWPVVLAAALGPRSWGVCIRGWRPASKNLRAKGWREWHRARRRDDDVLAMAAGRVPPAAGRRSVRCVVVQPGNRPDPINLVESLADALVAAGLLRDDSAEWAAVETPLVLPGNELVTFLLLEDL